ncbi:hypothetical protein GGR57DRAFT_451906 [Xylariaceae sp. FL1272]|nr:hypothetical protein GGR57DRAFT_451906 [Xylariaceae sp. FL1272]
MGIPSDWTEDPKFGYFGEGLKPINEYDVLDALLHVLFSLLPNLRHLQFFGSQDSLFRSIPLAMRHASDTVAASSIKLLKVHLPYHTFGTSPRALEIARDLIDATKTIKTLTIGRYPSGWLFDPQPWMAHIRSLRLENCWSGPRQLSNIIDSRYDLESSAYTAADKPYEFNTFGGGNGGTEKHFDAAAAVAVLGDHARTLKRLNLDLNGCLYEYRDKRPLTSLARLLRWNISLST